MTRCDPSGGALGLAAAVVLLAVCGVLISPYATGICDGSKRIRSRATLADPSTFVYVTSGRHELGSRVELRSAATGRLVKRVAAFGESFTDNGLAVSPDRAYPRSIVRVLPDRAARRRSR